MVNRIDNEVGMKRELSRRRGSVEARGREPGREPGRKAEVNGRRTAGAAAANPAAQRGVSNGAAARRKDQEGLQDMAAQTNPDQLVGILRDTVVALVRRDGPDLSARQLGVFLTVYLTDGPHTVRGLAAELNVSKPAITRALDRLGELDLARRKASGPPSWSGPGCCRRAAPPSGAAA